MSGEEFETLGGRFDQSAKRKRPRPHAGAAHGVLGNAYLGVMLVLIALLVVGAAISEVWLEAAGVKIALLMVFSLWLVLKARRVRRALPEGSEITARDVPELFGMIGDLGRALRSPRFHRALVTDEFNAAVVQAPRLGLFGQYRDYLLIGLPLANALNVEQFKAVLAHEFSHLSEERLWKHVARRADAMPRAGFGGFSVTGTRVAGEIDPASLDGWLARAFPRKTTLDDTDHSLIERLGASCMPGRRATARHRRPSAAWRSSTQRMPPERSFHRRKLTTAPI